MLKYVCVSNVQHVDVIVVVKQQKSHCCLQAKSVHPTSSDVNLMLGAFQKHGIAIEVVIALTAVTNAVNVLHCFLFITNDSGPKISMRVRKSFAESNAS